MLSHVRLLCYLGVEDGSGNSVSLVSLIGTSHHDCRKQKSKQLLKQKPNQLVFFFRIVSRRVYPSLGKKADLCQEEGHSNDNADV